jgi:cytochrome P450
VAEVAFNPFDPEFRKNPHPFYDKLRELEPVHITPLGFVVLTRYDDVVNTLRNNDFSRDIELNADLPETPTRKFKRENERSKSMLNLDPPDHTYDDWFRNRLRQAQSKNCDHEFNNSSTTHLLMPKKPENLNSSKN